MSDTSLQLASLGGAIVLALAACNEGDPADGAATGPTAQQPVEVASVSASATASASAAAPTERPPFNVILITVDSLRADMPWQGYGRDIAPNLTKLARESVVYPRAYSVASYTAKSVGALMASRYPSSLYRSSTFFTHYSGANLWFTELLQQQKVRTMAVHGHLYFDRVKNLSQGFDVWRLPEGLTWNNLTDESVTSHTMTPIARELLADPKNTSGRFFLWVHYMDPHDQYIQHEGTPVFGRGNRDRYDAEVHYTYRHLGELLAWGAQQPWWSRTAIVVSADHGEAFGEHEMHKHAFKLWEVLTRVPLIVYAPGNEARHIDARRSHIDLAPTVLELMGVPPDPGFVGKSLVAELYGAAPADHEPIVLDLPADGNNAPSRAIVAGDYKLLHDIVPNRFRLYHLGDDPGEVKDLAPDPKNADALARMKALYEKAWAAIPLVEPYGATKLIGGGRANGPFGPPGYDAKEPAQNP